MVTIESIDNSILIEAFIAWSGWGITPAPRRDPSILKNIFNERLAEKLTAEIEILENEFYLSDAKYTSPSIVEMGRIASVQFKDRHPEIPNQITEILAWCYTYDYK